MQKTLRVAAYCRVSTDDIDQAISIELQMRQYKEKIQSNPNYKYVGTYVDITEQKRIQCKNQLNTAHMERKYASEIKK